MKRFIIYILIINSFLFAGFDDMDPLKSTSHDTATVSSSKSLTISWNRASSSDGDVLKGYYYILDKVSNTLIPNVVDTRKSVGSEATTLVTSILTDGEWYFHLAPYSETANIGATLHFGPMKIDTIAPTVSISPNGGVFDDSTSVSVSATDVNDYTIYYTTNSDEPTQYSTKYSAPITVSQDTTVKAIAIDVAKNQSDIASSLITINVDSSDVVFGSEISNGDKIVLSGDSATTSLSVKSDAATLYDYKINSGSWQEDQAIASPISLLGLSLGNHSITIRTAGTTNEKTISFEVVDKLVAPPDDVTVDVSSINITTDTVINFNSNNTIYYTIDGSNPDEQSLTGTSYKITSDNNGTLVLKLVAYDSEGTRSANVITKTFSVSIPVTIDSSSSSNTSSSSSDTSSNSSLTTTTTNETTSKPATSNTIAIEVPMTYSKIESDGTKVYESSSVGTDKGAVIVKKRIHSDGTVTPEMSIDGKEITLPTFPVGAQVITEQKGGKITIIVNTPLKTKIKF